jgi:cbb3-type cytochrome oxidase maturation protein
MEILALLLPLSVGVVFVIAAAFWWSIDSGQFDDLEGPAYRILSDEDRVHIGSHDPGAARAAILDADQRLAHPDAAQSEGSRAPCAARAEGASR